MLQYSDQGSFQLKQFPTVFHYATRFDNLMNYNLENLKKRVKKGIRKGILKYEYQKRLEFDSQLTFENVEFKEYLENLKKYCSTINDSLKKEKEEVDLKRYFQLFLDNFDKFFLLNIMIKYNLLYFGLILRLSKYIEEFES